MSEVTIANLLPMATQQESAASASSGNQQGSGGSSSSSSSSSNSSSGVSGDNSPPPPPHPDDEEYNNNNDDDDDDDAESRLRSRDGSVVFSNKQLIAHLLKTVCAVGNNNNNNNNNNNYYYGGRSGSGSSHSASPPSDDSQQHQRQQQHQTHQGEHHHHHHHQQQDPPAAISTDHLSVASSAYSTGGGVSFSSASPAYVSPFAQSPISEASPWLHPAISLDVLQDPRTVELERVLLRLCEEFEHRLHDKFEDFGSKLDTEPATIRDSVTRELQALFYDGNFHWGRVIAVFALCREICNKCRAEGRPQLVAPVQMWVAEFVDSHLWDWMVVNQGWLGLLKFYRDTGGDKSTTGTFGEGASAWHSVASLLTFSAVSIAIALAAAYFRR